MPALSSELRRQLENAVIDARDRAVVAARSALHNRAVDAAEPFPHFTAADREQRNRLRARGRQVGDVRRADKTQGIDQLVQELAYEFWHRMLFARFLAENHLLMHPDGVAVSLDECDELAPSADPPAANGFALAARYAGTMLPQIFRTDDVLLEIEFAPEHRLALEQRLARLPRETFLADDSLGWVYQFWQTNEKERVNKSGDKIDGRTLPAVTQLFTEHYMVQFLLDNTIGAWWCAKEGIQPRMEHGSNTDGKPEFISGIDPCSIRVPSVAPPSFEYLRWRDDGTPAAGTFAGWPKTLAEFTMLDPCCGSGHFLVSGFNLLVPLRMHDDRLSAREACDAVLRDNLFGLEIDPRCTQIAAFALALAAWKYPGEDGQPLGYRPLPRLHIACSGQGVAGKKDDWLALANGDSRLRDGMDRLYDLFQQAPHLGSLIDPRREKGDFYEAGYAELQPLLVKALAKKAGDADLAAVGVAAQGITRAAELLGGRYTLISTNVPYKGRGELIETVTDYFDLHYRLGNADLATAFAMRCLELCEAGGSASVVTKLEPLFLITYRDLRNDLLKRFKWNLVALLGPRAFETVSGERVNVAILVQSALKPAPDTSFIGLDVRKAKTAKEKAISLVECELAIVLQVDQLRNPDSVLTLMSFDSASTELLGVHGDSLQGTTTGDNPRFVQQFWEQTQFSDQWMKFRTTVDSTVAFGGCELVAVNSVNLIFPRWDESATNQVWT